MWSDKTGQFTVEAEYLGLNGTKIRLHKVNGVIIEVPLDKMSPEDMQLVKRHETRKQRRQSQAPIEEEPSPSSSRREDRSDETRARGTESPAIPAAAMEMPKTRKPRYDWFAFFLDAGCDMDDCTRYASNFERDRIDEAILPDLEPSTLRSLGLKEGDVIRVRKTITNKFRKENPESEAQISADELYARQLQEHENSGGKGPAPQPPPGLFTGPDGKLSNNTRRGRPEKKAGADTVDPSAIAAASDQLSRSGISTPPPVAVSPPLPEKAPLITGFDDDAWTIKPSITKPASPAPPPQPAQPLAPQPRSAVTNGTDSLLAQIQSLRPATGLSASNTGSGDFDRLSAMVGQPQAQSPGPMMQPQQTGFAQSYGLGVQNNPSSMAQLLNSPRGPLAPVPANEGLLNPILPNMTGMFVPTRASPISAQQTGYGSSPVSPMVMQPTGYAAGFQQAYGGQPQQIQPSELWTLLQLTPRLHWIPRIPSTRERFQRSGQHATPPASTAELGQICPSKHLCRDEEDRVWAARRAAASISE